MSFIHTWTCQDKRFGDDFPVPASTLYFRRFKKVHPNYFRRCPCCNLKFIEDTGFGHPTQGYTTEDDVIWVCLECTPHYAQGFTLVGGPKVFARAEPSHPGIDQPSPEG